MNRAYGTLTAPDIANKLTADSILCLPFGSYEQHGPHLPLHTDTAIAEGFTHRLTERYGDQFDLWTLPAIPFGLSLEHSWSPGTISLTIHTVTSLLSAIASQIAHATPAHRLIIINGHGGNRGLLEPALHELQRDHGLRLCALHPSSLSAVRTDAELPEVHAGIRETSMMLALRPTDVHLDRLPADYSPDVRRHGEIHRQILDRGTTWPWSSGDSRIAALGITGGNPQMATADHGEAIINSALDACQATLQNL